jgi:hypothetical protein
VQINHIRTTTRQKKQINTKKTLQSQYQERSMGLSEGRSMFREITGRMQVSKKMEA